VAEQIEAARNGSQEALGWLLERFRADLLRIANAQLDAQLKSKGSASDIVQETFLAAQQAFGRFYGGSSGELHVWLRAILLNKMATFARSYRKTGKRQLNREIRLGGLRGPGDVPVPEPPAAEPTPSSCLLAKERSHALHEALARLPEHYRQIIHWRLWEELPFEEIARRLERGVDAARMLWWRAIACLEKELKGSR
jgi:RNA polymerase sigma-70 factor (ECF subfamily)